MTLGLTRIVSTIILAAILVSSFLATLILGGHSTAGEIDVLDLTALGGASGRLIGENGEYWRIVSAPLLHASWQHCLINVVAITMIGSSLEKRAGPIWFWLSVITGGLAGALFSVETNPANAISVGASGMVCALLMTNLIALIREPKTSTRVVGSGLTLILLLAALTPSPDNAAGTVVDIATHLGGLMAGFGVGFALWQAWPPENQRPDIPKFVRYASHALLAAVIVAIAIAFLAGSTYRERYQVYAARHTLVSAAGNPTALDRVIAAYPSDPRPKIGRAGFDLVEGNYPAARERLQTAIDEPNLIRDLGVGIAMKATMLLSYAALLEGDDIAAKSIAKPVCPYAHLDPTLDKIHADLIEREICPTKDSKS